MTWRKEVGRNLKGVAEYKPLTEGSAKVLSAQHAFSQNLREAFLTRLRGGDEDSYRTALQTVALQIFYTHRSPITAQTAPWHEKAIVDLLKCPAFETDEKRQKALALKAENATRKGNKAK